ncbi:MAG: hypothetical protein HKN48_09085 [Flavobacteriaceae bacterium]|nr:hypothetical protein [Flavobacteriaceae bacterium]
MSTKIIYLKLTGSKPDYQLQWSYDQSTWAKVQPKSPSTEIKPGDELDWNADESISKMKIKFAKGNIISNKDISGNDSKNPKGRVKNGVGQGLSDSYTITVKPSDGGSTGEYDPDIKTPNSGGG